GGRRPGGGVHAAPPAQLHRRGLQDPHDRERAAANRRRSAARPRGGAAGQCDAAVEGATLGRRAARRAGISEDLLVVLRRHEPARRGAQVRERAGRRDECRGAQSRATVLRLHRVPQVSWRSGPGRRTLRADAQGRRGIPDLRRGPPPGLAGSGRRKPRWFAPAVSGVWVQAVHDGKSVALRVSWDDRSHSPDTTWLGFERRALETVAGDDSGAGRTADPFPDQLVVQFPRRIPEGMERPYFLMGAETDPVYQWRWTSATTAATAGAAVGGLARGLDRFDTLPGGPGVQTSYEHGEWRIVFTRSLATPDTANELQFAAGRAIPVAFFAWDGSSGE